ncbi:hypothetical protein [Streptomyces tubercidicus]
MERARLDGFRRRHVRHASYRVRVAKLGIEQHVVSPVVLRLQVVA